MKSVKAALMVAVLGGVQPLSGQIGQEVEPRRDVVAPATQERTHVVRPGDTLWDLAGTYYGNPFTWPTIYDANTAVVEDPHWIYPEEVLVVPGQPTAIAEGPPSDPGMITPVGRPAPRQDATPARTRFYRQNEMSTDIAGDEAVSRSGVQPGEYYSAPWIGNPDRLPVVGAVLRAVDSPASARDDDLLVHPFDELYLEYRGTTRPQAGERLLVLDRGREFHDGDDLFVIRPAGVLTVVSSGTEVMTVRVTEQWGAFTRGAPAVPLEPFPAIRGMSERLSDGPVGRVTGFAVEQALYGDTDHGFLDLGEDRAQVGDVVMIYRTARAGDTVLPPEPIAFGKIVRVGPTGSTFRITRAIQRRLEPGLPAQIVRRIP